MVEEEEEEEEEEDEDVASLERCVEGVTTKARAVFCRRRRSARADTLVGMVSWCGCVGCPSSMTLMVRDRRRRSQSPLI